MIFKKSRLTMRFFSATINVNYLMEELSQFSTYNLDQIKRKTKADSL